MYSRKKVGVDHIWKYEELPPGVLIKSLHLEPAAIDHDELSSPFTPLTVLRISDYIRELVPPGVFNVVTGGHGLWPWLASHSGIDLITFTRWTNIGKHISESAPGSPKPLTRERGGNNLGAVIDADPEKLAVFGSIALVPVTCKPGTVWISQHTL